MTDRKALEKSLIELRTEHRDLDEAIAALGATRPHDPLKIQRLKKRKLGLKDRINRQLSAPQALAVPDPLSDD